MSLKVSTLVTVVMFPILVFMYARLAKREEADTLSQFGEQYRRYAQSVPASSRNRDIHQR